MSKRPNVYVWTDGACDNLSNGGWAATIKYEGRVIHFSGREEDTTNNRMELLAAIRALEVLTRSCTVHIYSDSQYVVQGITKSIKKWEKMNWSRGPDSPLRNADLWKRLGKAMEPHVVYAHWVRGHNGNPNNEIVDGLAQYQRTLLLSNEDRAAALANQLKRSDFSNRYKSKTAEHVDMEQLKSDVNETLRDFAY